MDSDKKYHKIKKAMFEDLSMICHDKKKNARHRKKQANKKFFPEFDCDITEA